MDQKRKMFLLMVLKFSIEDYMTSKEIFLKRKKKLVCFYFSNFVNSLETLPKTSSV